MSTTNTSDKSNKMAGKKQTKTEVPATTVAAPVATPVKAPKAKKVVAKSEVSVPVANTATTVQSSEALLASLTEQLKAISTEFNTKVRAAVHAAQEAAKQTKREQRNSKRRVRKDPATMTPEERKAWEARRANNAFLVQRQLSDELSNFMGLKAGEKRSQTDVTKFLSNYIKTHNCFDPSFKRRIIPNPALAKLLRVGDKDEVTYLNLQRYLKVHFIKKTVA